MAKHSEDKIKLIQLDYENGKSISELSLLYGVSQGTIKYWSSNKGWIKKKQNKPTKRITNRKKKKQTNQIKINLAKRDIEIKKDILKDMPKEEILEKYRIKKDTYYSKRKSIRELVVERNKAILESVSDGLIPNKEERLAKYKTIKMDLLNQIEQSILNDEVDKLKPLNDKLNLLIKAEKELYKELRLKVTFEEATFEKDLTDEQIQRERLDIERSKLKDKVKETENESKSLELLNRLVGETNGTNE